MNRISAVCSLIDSCGVFADVGCDHGKVAHYVVKNGLAQKVIASDVSEKCLNKAKKLIGDGAAYALADGIKFDCDEAAICGMGGAQIVKILREAACAPNELILSPHTDSGLVREYLINSGYKIERDFMIEDGKYYTLIKARKSQDAQSLSKCQVEFGVFYNSDETTRAYLKKKLDELKTYKITRVNQEKIARIEEALSEDQRINRIS